MSEPMCTLANDIIPASMKAARILEFGEPLTVCDVPVPVPGHGQVLVKLTVCGVCHTDVHMRDGDLLAIKPTIPLTLGVGHVCKLGPGVTRWVLGDRVCCPCQCSACGSCEHCCWSGWETACEQALLAGGLRDGFFAQYTLMNEQFLCKVPIGVSDEDVAPVNCAGVTTYKALKVSGAKAGEWVVIVGAAGGLGFYALQYAKAMGLNVIALDSGRDIKDYLTKKGVVALDSSDGGAVASKIKELTGGQGAHAVVTLVPSGKVVSRALAYLRKRGVLVVVGLPPDEVKFDPVLLTMRMITIRGSLVGTRLDLMEALSFVADGRVRSEPRMRDFSELNEVLDELADGRSMGRNVVRIPQ